MISTLRPAMALLALVSAPALAQGALELLHVQGNVHMIAGPGGNTAVQVGPEAVVIVDTQTAAVSAELLDVVAGLSAKPIRHVVVTSADSDHTGGNAAVSAAGTYVRLIDSFDPRGSDTNAAIIAHVNVLAAMSTPALDGTEIPSEAWPTDTYFTDEWALFVNGEAIELLHVPMAHTDGDTMVFFRRSDVLIAGDIFNMDRYPSFDIAAGGIDGIIEGLNLILDIAIAGENQEGGTIVIPGHGRMADETDVANYRDMVTIIRHRVQVMIDDGATLTAVKAAGLSRDYDGNYSNPWRGWTGEQLVEAIYQDLKDE